MRLYSGPSLGFLDDTVHNRIADKLKDAFFGYFWYYPSPSEVGSWGPAIYTLLAQFL